MRGMRVSILLSLVLLISYGITGIVYGSESVPQTIKIGLEKPLKSNVYVRIGSNEGFVISKDAETITHLTSKADTDILVRTDTYVEKTDGSYVAVQDSEEASMGPIHLSLSTEFESYEEALAKVEDLDQKNITAYPVYTGVFKVWIGHFVDKSQAEKMKESLDTLLGTDMTLINDDGDRVIIESLDGSVFFMYDTEEKLSLKPMNQGDGNLLQVEDHKYRGDLLFNVVSDELKVINKLPTNAYLYGVVPREVSASWPIESIKAQAVAARNYMLINMDKHKSEGFDLCDTQDCQVYAGYDWETEKTNRAVEETHDMKITHEGKLISAFYHSNSGGHTENSENVWSFPLPYLQGVEDQFSVGAPNSEWQLALNKVEIEEKLHANNIDVGELISIEPIEWSENGRVTKSVIKGTEGVEFIQKESMRKILGYGELKSIWFDMETDATVHVVDGMSGQPKKVSLGNVHVLSANSNMVANRSASLNTHNGLGERYIITDGNNVVDKPLVASEYLFKGQGWGHGLGMSQWGAKKMAEEGYNYKEILEYYYTGTKVE